MPGESKAALFPATANVTVIVVIIIIIIIVDLIKNPDAGLLLFPDAKRG